MRVIRSLIVLLVIHLHANALEPESVTFRSLSQAAVALDEAMAAPDPSAALKALLPSPKTYFSQHPNVARILVEEHKKTGSLAKLYADRRFPSEIDAYKLGGHASELGHIHIDFVRHGNEWKLKDIWNCR